MATKKFQKVTVYLYSQEKPLVYEEDWAYFSTRELSDTRAEEFIQLGPNYVRKSDISKIFVENIEKEVEEKKENENNEGN